MQNDVYQIKNQNMDNIYLKCTFVIFILISILYCFCKMLHFVTVKKIKARDMSILVIGILFLAQYSSSTKICAMVHLFEASKNDRTVYKCSRDLECAWFDLV